MFKKIYLKNHKCIFAIHDLINSHVSHPLYCFWNRDHIDDIDDDNDGILDIEDEDDDGDGIIDIQVIITQHLIVTYFPILRTQTGMVMMKCNYLACKLWTIIILLCRV